MAPLLTDEESAIDPYAALEVEQTASERDVQRAYRKKSLKCHPDRNPSPEAAVMFRQISLAMEMLLDVSKRQFIDGKLEADRRHKAKYAEMDKKRKAMVDALVAREEEAKRAKVAQVERRKQAAEEETIKDAGRRLLEEAQKRAREAAMASSSVAVAAAAVSGPTPSASTHSSKENENGTRSDAQPPISSEDLTLLLSFPSSSAMTLDDLRAILKSRYGPVSHVILTEPPAPAGAGTGGADGKKKKKKEKGKKGIVEFEKSNWGGCWACWDDHADQQKQEGSEGGQGQEARGKRQRIEDGVKARWAGGVVPAWVEWAEKQQEHHRQDPQGGARQSNGNDNGHGHGDGLENANGNGIINGRSHAPPSFSFASAPDLSGGSATMSNLLSQHRNKLAKAEETKKNNEQFESMTLLRMRQMERERLAEQIRREDEED